MVLYLCMKMNISRINQYFQCNLIFIFMKIYLDNIIYSLQKSGGISVVWTEMLKGILMQEFDYKCLEYNNAKDNFFRKEFIIPSCNIENNDYKMLSIQRYCNPKIKNSPNKPFIFHSSYYRYSTDKNAINFTTVHDFTYEYYSRGLKKTMHSCQKNKAIKESDFIICISETTKKDLLHFVPNVDESKIHVIYNGVSDDYYVLENKSELKHNLGDFVLFIGSRASYKNFDLAVEALKQTSFNLVIVGDPLLEDEKKYIQNQLGENRFYELGRLSNKQLNLVYNQAYCLLYPSSYEGFGIPVIEAQKAGCPVIVLDAPSIVEIIGDKTLVASDLKTIVDKIDILKDTHIRNLIISNGLNNSSSYSWEKMREGLFKLYLEALKF